MPKMTPSFFRFAAPVWASHCVWLQCFYQCSVLTLWETAVRKLPVQPHPTPVLGLKSGQSSALVMTSWCHQQTSSQITEKGFSYLPMLFLLLHAMRSSNMEG